MELLDPKTDIVFKMLFTAARNERLLVSLIAAVLQPKAPIVSAKVLDRELPKDYSDEKGMVLDVLVRLADGARVNLEMQCDRRGAVPKRWLYGWARLFGEGIARGEGYSELLPVACIVFLDARVGERFHAVYRVLEQHDHVSLTDALQIHLVELPRIAESTANEPAELLRWVRFLRARDASELDSLGREDPIMADAKEALERLSEDPEARRLAEMRLKARVNLAVIHRQGVAEGRELGRAEGREEAREEGRELARAALRQAVLDALAVRGIHPDAAASARIASETNTDTLRHWVARAVIATDLAAVLDD